MTIDEKDNIQNKIESVMEYLVRAKSDFTAPELREEFIVEAYHLLFQLREEINIEKALEV